MYPLVVSDLSIDQLLEAIERVTGMPLVRVPTDQGSVGRNAGSPLLAGEVGGHSYLVDLGAALLASMQSHLSKIALECECLIVASSFDRTESQCEFFAVQGDEVLRLFWHNAIKTTKDYSSGSQLDSEVDAPLSTPDGSGLTAALRSFGFHQMDYTKGFQRAPGDFVVTWAGDALECLSHDSLAQQINNHVRNHPNPDYRAPVPRVTIRPMDK